MERSSGPYAIGFDRRVSSTMIFLITMALNDAPLKDNIWNYPDQSKHIKESCSWGNTLNFLSFFFLFRIMLDVPIIESLLGKIFQNACQSMLNYPGFPVN